MYLLDFKLPQIITRKQLNIALLLIGFGAIIFYMTCLDACAGVAGSLLGIDLTYVGMLYLGAISFALLLGWQVLAFWMLAAGAGGEIFLIGYQVRTGDYCMFCLLFASVVIAMAAVNFCRTRIRALLLAVPLGFIMLWLSFAAAPVISYGAATIPSLPVFGNGPAEVRLYTDYFCGPCSRIEPELEDNLVALVESGKARVVFVDVPLHRHSPLYATYFLAMLQTDGNIQQAISDRNLLFAAARQKLNTPESLAQFLNNAGREVAMVTTQADFSFHNQMLTEDQVRTTPTLVIRKKENSVTFKGTSKVIEGIDQLIQAGRG